MDKPYIGQKLFSLNIGNAARNCEQVLTPVEVTKVGRKYFTANEPGKDWGERRYLIDGWREATDFCVDSELFIDKQEWLDKKECNLIAREISESFRYSGYPSNLNIDDLRAIDAIMKKRVEDE